LCVKEKLSQEKLSQFVVKVVVPLAERGGMDRSDVCFGNDGPGGGYFGAIWIGFTDKADDPYGAGISGRAGDRTDRILEGFVFCRT
jgi:hypothetical protein